ncbi:hypothetical protein ACE38V_08320 [Cytobacillus sp. Hz8]
MKQKLDRIIELLEKRNKE